MTGPIRSDLEPFTVPRPARTLSYCGILHFLHDGALYALYVLFPLVGADLRLSFTQVGALKTAFSGCLGLSQFPAGFLAQRTGEFVPLLAGTLLLGGGIALLPFAWGFAPLLFFLGLGGFGSGVQHPLSSSLVSRAYDIGPRRRALGTYNMAGDLGKVALPALIGIIAVAGSWRVGAWGLAFSLLMVTGLVAMTGGGALTTGPLSTSARSRPRRPSSWWGIEDRRRFILLTILGAVDDATRAGFVLFLPFVLQSQGLGPDQIGWCLALLFLGGAGGKFVCGALAEGVGITAMVVITEVSTALGLLFIPRLPVALIALVLPLMGIVLNGTSSVLYATVADLVSSEKRAQGYGLYYTMIQTAGALSPIIAGRVADGWGLSAAFTLMAGILLTITPVSYLLRGLTRLTMTPTPVQREIETH
ncbi:MAG: MFS transporter [Gemmatimonadota bacterium]